MYFKINSTEKSICKDNELPEKIFCTFYVYTILYFCVDVICACTCVHLKMEYAKGHLETIGSVATIDDNCIFE